MLHETWGRGSGTGGGAEWVSMHAHGGCRRDGYYTYRKQHSDVKYEDTHFTLVFCFVVCVMGARAAVDHNQGWKHCTLKFMVPDGIDRAGHLDMRIFWHGPKSCPSSMMLNPLPATTDRTCTVPTHCVWCSACIVACTAAAFVSRRRKSSQVLLRSGNVPSTVLEAGGRGGVRRRGLGRRGETRRVRRGRERGVVLCMVSGACSGGVCVCDAAGCAVGGMYCRGRVLSHF